MKPKICPECGHWNGGHHQNCPERQEEPEVGAVDEARFRVIKGRKDGRRIFGFKGYPGLLIVGDRVINGEWDVRWLNKEETRGECKLNPGSTFDYICHDTKPGPMDYNEILWACLDAYGEHGFDP